MSKEYKLCACPLDCFDLCSIRAEIMNNKVTKLEGNKEHPITQGFICEKGRKHTERMYSPLRIKQPLKKVNNQFVEISWDEALDTIAFKLKHYIDEYGTLSIAQFNDGGAGGLLKNIENLFFDYLGDVTLFNGSLCWAAGITAQELDFGDVKGHSPDDVLNSRTIIIWGRNPAETNIHLMPFLKKAKGKGAQIVLIDPIATATTAICDWHIQPNPGGDWAFACAVAKQLLDKKLYDEGFIRKYTKGFEELEGYLNTLSYKQLYEICGVGEDIIIRFVEEFLLDKPATIYIGYGVQRYSYGGTAVRAIDMLGALAGVIGVSGGGVNYANRIYGKHISWEAVAPLKTPQHRYVAKPKLAAALSKIDKPKVKMLFISRSNPVVQLPDTEEAVRTISNIEFKVVLEHFMTDTAKLADIVLPVTYFMEETDIIYSSMWNGYIFYNEGLVPRYFGSKPEFEIYSLLAEKMQMKEFPQLREEQWIDVLLGGTGALGVDLEALNKNSFVCANTFESVPWSDFNFKTTSGKFEFIGAAALMKCQEAAANDRDNTFRLLTVHTKESLHSQHLITADTLQPQVYINKADAEMLGILDNELIKLQNQYGDLDAVATVSDTCQKGVLYMKQGWWFKNGGSVNRLTSHEVSDIGNQAIYNECRCKIIKIGVNNE